MEHVNRKGERYYIFEGKTKTGKPKYFASKKPSSEKAVLVEALPDGFEVFEKPDNATVTVRRRRPSRVLAAERDFVDRKTLDLSAYSCVQTIIDGDKIVIYTPQGNPLATAAVFTHLLGSAPDQDEWMGRFTRYHAELRFKLVDADRRLFVAERFCYRGSIDGWIKLSGPSTLELLAKQLVGHLGKESFYELF